MPDLETLKRTPQHRVADPDMQPVVRGGRLRPQGARIVVRPDEEEERTESGIVLPWTARDHRRAQSGTVITIGPDVLDLRPGNRVLYRQWGGIECFIDGELHLLLRTRQPEIEPPDVFALLATAP